MEHGQSPPLTSTSAQPLFFGLDLSTQQLKVVVLEQGGNNTNIATTTTNNINDDDLRAHSSFTIHFDSELPHYRTRGGVHAQQDQSSGVVTAPVLMWVEALERVLEKMKVAQFPFHRVVSISGAAQQHGSVYWSCNATQAFDKMCEHSSKPSSSSSSSKLVEIFKDAFTVKESPIWQDTSTTSQCEEMEVFLGRLDNQRRGCSSTITTTADDDDAAAEEEESKVRLLGQQRLAELTGSRAYERYTGSQILKIVQERPEVYRSTTRISLVSSFLASLLIARYASIDVADGSGMNLLDIRTKTWDPVLTRFIDQGGQRGNFSKDEAVDAVNLLMNKLGEVDASGKKVQGVLSSWFVSRYGFMPDVKVVTFTGDNPATVMALRAERGDAIVSLGTSDTLLLYTDTLASISDTDNDNFAISIKGKQDARSAARLLSVGYLCHPVDPNGYLMLYCAKNGSLAREQVRDLYADSNWDRFDQYLRDGMREEDDSGVGFYFFDREIWPPVQGVYRFENGVAVDEFGQQENTGDSAQKRVANVVAICESQFLAMRVRSSQEEATPSPSPSLNPPGISRILATGGASSNRVLLQLLANVFGVPVVSMSTDDQQPGAGSAAWGAARKAYLYGQRHSGTVDGVGRVKEDDDNNRYFGRRKSNTNESCVAILPDLAQTKKYVDRIPEFLRLEAFLL
ncbi:hypothetical protein BG015_004609 [Linnemannia schmuckeri]|uniref:Xylulose kinase n=1 Tax=Linnemannia schmuckeri TaxID=64567 RepID=A0A9P5S1E5_9FUNG|nr:hypothetical protein BG015_004609 [Linnemannia schmuckeri]